MSIFSYSLFQRSQHDRVNLQEVYTEKANKVNEMAAHGAAIVKDQ